MTVWIVNTRSGARSGPFADYVAAAEFRRDVLRPQLDPTAHCPFAIRIDCPERAAADAKFDQFCRETTAAIGALPKRAEQLEMFGTADLVGAWLAQRSA